MNTGEHVVPANFDEVAWIRRLGVELEEVAAKARPLRPSRPPELGEIPRTDLSETARHEANRLLARVERDLATLWPFLQSHLSVRDDPVEAQRILREHPLVHPWLVVSGETEAIEVTVLNRRYRADLSWLAERLAELSVKEDGKAAARRLHRFLTALADASVPADEIIVFHGLIVAKRVDLGRGAYLAPYEHARIEFDLPEEPEPFPNELMPDAAVLVRGLACTPASVRADDRGGFCNTRARYRFPTNYTITLNDWFEDAKFLVDLLLIGSRARLLSNTRYVQFPRWIREIDPRAYWSPDSGGHASDVWPRGRELSQRDIEAFIETSRDWYTQTETPPSLKLAVRRLAASFSRPGGLFGEEDRILDVAIALEIFYGGKQGHVLAKRAARLLGADATEQIRTYDQARRFYRVRSKIVHTNRTAPAAESLSLELEAGQNLAARSLSCLLKHRQPMDWAQVQPHLEADAEAHVAQHRPTGTEGQAFHCR